MNPLLTSLTGDSEHLDAGDRAILDAALRNGLPGARSERWRYTPLRALERRSFAAAVEVAAPKTEALQRIPAPRLVFVNGFHSADLSDTTGLPDGIALLPRRVDDAWLPSIAADTGADAVFAQINQALARNGFSLRVAIGTNFALPLHLVFVGASATEDQAWHLRHDVEIADGASAMIVEHHVSVDPHRHFASHVLSIRLGANAVLRHARIQDDADGATLIQETRVTVSERAEYRRVDLELGAALSRHELMVSLAGRHATLSSGGVLFADGRRHLDTRLDIRHAARDTACDLRWRGLASGRSRAVFHGGIVIEPGADGSDARLSNKNLLLSADAEIDAQPVLEIHADEVKAAHGATVGRLDENALFYLRSRGLPLADARQLLIAAFCREPIRVLDDSSLTGLLTGLIDERLSALEEKG